MIPSLDSYEGEGNLYIRKEVTVTSAGRLIEAIVYVYNRSVVGAKKLRESWNSKDDDYVWYAAYGSNLDEERFACYIKGGINPYTGKSNSGCNDKSLWIDDRMTKYPGTIYFGQNSGSWGNTGVAFYDDSLEFRLHNSTFMRLYKITRNQLHDVQNQECNSPNWYGRLVCLDILEDGCEVYTFTAETKQKLNEPSDVYANLIHDTLVRLGASHEFGIDNYIAGLSKGLEIKIREKGSRKNAEYNEKMNHLVKADCDMLIKASEQNSNGIVYKSELYAKDSMPVMPFRIVVEDTYDGEFRQVVVKRIEYHKIDGIIHEEITELNRSWWKE